MSAKRTGVLYLGTKKEEEVKFKVQFHIDKEK